MQPTHPLVSALLPTDASGRPPVAFPESGPTFPRWKRGLDVACGVAALPVLGGATLIGAMVTSLTSPGPLLFRTSVVGENGRTFGMYRFRTLHLAASDSNAPLSQSAPLPYLSGGERLRRSGWVNLPQVINVLRGEMTMVGTRPTERTRSPGDSVRQGTGHIRPGLINLTQAPLGASPSETVTAETTLTAELRIITRSALAGLAAMLRRADASRASSHPHALS